MYKIFEHPLLDIANWKIYLLSM